MSVLRHHATLWLVVETLKDPTSAFPVPTATMGVDMEVTVCRYLLHSQLRMVCVHSVALCCPPAIMHLSPRRVFVYELVPSAQLWYVMGQSSLCAHKQAQLPASPLLSVTLLALTS
jgi:hypothetical protein